MPNKEPFSGSFSGPPSTPRCSRHPILQCLNFCAHYNLPIPGILDRFSRCPEAFRIIELALVDADPATVAAGAAAAAAAAEVDSLRNVWLRGVPVGASGQRASVPPDNLLPSLAKLLTTAR